MGYTFLSYFDFKSNFDNATHMRKTRKTRFFMKFRLLFFICSCRLNSKTLKCREILHFQKHSSLCNRFWKRTMFFVFSFFHLLCNLRISMGPLSVTKNKIFSNLHYIFFVNFSFICFFFMFEYKLCKKISIMIYLNDYFSLIIQIQSF